LSNPLRSSGLILIPTIKRQLAGKTLTQESFKSICRGLPGLSQKRDSPLPFGHGMRGVRSASLGAADMSRNLENETIENLQPFFFI
jgi:hypothetical protein